MLNLNHLILIIKYLCAYLSVAGFLLLPNSFELFLATIKHETSMRCSIYSHTLLSVITASPCQQQARNSQRYSKYLIFQNVFYFYIFIFVAAVYFHHATENKRVCIFVTPSDVQLVCIVRQKIKLWAILSTENDKDWMIYKNYISKHIYLIS